MKKKLEEFTLKQLKDLCEEQKDCETCPIGKVTKVFCEILKSDLSNEIEFGVVVKPTYYLNNITTVINNRIPNIEVVKYKDMYITGGERDKVSLFFTVRPGQRYAYIPRITFKVEYTYYKNNFNIDLVTWNSLSDIYLIVYSDRRRK